jgi:uncharacterized protein (TIGR02147 family)
MVSLPDFKEEPAWISRKLRPNIRPSEAKEALDLLLQLNYLKQNESGKLVQTNPELSTGPEVRSLNIINYHHNLLHLANLSLIETEPLQRDVSALAMVIDEEEFKYIKGKMREFRAEIIEYMRDRKKIEFKEKNIFKKKALYHLTMQLFNSTKLE